MIDSTVVIPTIGRATLPCAIESALREGFEVIVVGDGPIAREIPDSVRYIELGKRFGFYGSMAYNVGAVLAPTDFITSLADDDELGQGFGPLLRDRLNANPDVDIWIPRLEMSDGTNRCRPEEGVVLGNAAAPTYRRDIFTNVPFTHDLTDRKDIIDFHHILVCIQRGYRLAWATELEYLVRPRLDGNRGLEKHPIRMV